MENYIVSARKYRPSTFKTVVGQQALTHTLKSAIDSDRLAHAYLFCGPRGVGKTSCARIFAKTINCLNPTAEGESCNECESCKAFNEQRSYNIVELDAASNNSVDDIRNLIDQVQIPPQIGKYRVFIIDEVHMLSQQAFNAFLKTLEEPPAHAIFILATTEKHKILPTILSRCQIYDFARITISDIVDQLKYISSQEGITADPAALNVIAQKADGAMRDALSIFDQVAASSEGNITYKSTIENLNVLDYEYYFRLMEAFRTCNVNDALLIYKEIRDRGFDSLFFINGLAQHLRDMMVAMTPATHSLLEMSKDVAQRFITEAPKYHPRFYYRALDLCNTCDLNYRASSNKQFLVELTLIKLCQILDVTNPPTGGGDGKPLKKVASQSAAPQPTTPQKPAAAAPQAMHNAPTQDIKASAPSGGGAKLDIEVLKTHIAPPATVTGRVIPKMPSNVAAPPRIFINNKEAAAAVAEEKNVYSRPRTSHEVRREAFSDEQLTAVWQQFVEEHPREPLIVNTMRVALPKRKGPDKFEIEVENIGQVEFVKAHESEILSYLRNGLKNDMVAFDVKVREGGPAPKLWTSREIIEDMVLRNPGVEKLIRDFELGLA